MANESCISLNLDAKQLLQLSKLNVFEEEIIENTEKFKAETFRESDTPETLLSTEGQNYDITIFCQQCLVHIDINSLQYHRAFHNALATLQFSCLDKPSDTQTLIDRRNLLTKIIKDEVSDKKQFKKIDDAYELIKSDILGVNHELSKIVNRNVDFDVQSFSLKCALNCIYAIGIASSQNSLWKNEMEDAKVFEDCFGEDRDKCYLAIFDGYHGSNAASKCGQNLHHFLFREMANFDSKIRTTEGGNTAEFAMFANEFEFHGPEVRNSATGLMHQESKILVQEIIKSCYNSYNEQTGGEAVRKKKTLDYFSEQMRKAFRNAYDNMDIMLSYGIDEKSKIRWSGTSAVTCLIEQEYNADSGQINPEGGGKIYIANVGFIRALLVRDNKYVQITKDHTPNNINECRRIHKRGGYITSSEKGPLVNGVLPVTRGLGNFGDKLLKDCVVTEPYFKSIKFDQQAQFLVLASSGIWQVLSDEEVTSLLTRMLPNQHMPPPSRISESLLPLLSSESSYCQKDSNLPSQQTNYVNQAHINTAEISKDLFHTQESGEDTKLDLAKVMAEQLTCAALLAGCTENITVAIVLLPGCGLTSLV
ncbi:hypothetical protein Btru_030815 [Bulinus truncatus]|nr:hypothetical protein Btru_030815 [Bulinus truncatus]